MTRSWSADLNATLGKQRPRPQILKPLPVLPDRCYHDRDEFCTRCVPSPSVSLTKGPKYVLVDLADTQGEAE